MKAKWLIWAFLPALVMGLSSCGDDDGNGDNDGVDKEILGQWQTMKIEGWEDDPSDTFEQSFGDTGPVVTFNENGTYEISSGERGTFTYRNRTLRMDGATMKVTISGSEMVTEESGNGYYEKTTFRRIYGGGDDENMSIADPVPNYLIGTWAYLRDVDEKDITPVEDADYEELVFNADGTVEHWEWRSTPKAELIYPLEWINDYTGTYSLSGNKVTWTWNPGPGFNKEIEEDNHYLGTSTFAIDFPDANTLLVGVDDPEGEIEMYQRGSRR